MTKGERLRHFREERGLNQTQISKALNISPRNWSRYEADTTSPPQEVLIDLAKIGLNIHWYMTGENDGRLTSQPDGAKILHEEANKSAFMEANKEDTIVPSVSAETLMEASQKEALVVVDGGVEQGVLIPVIAQGLSAGFGFDYDEGEIIRYIKVPAWLARKSKELVALPIYGESMEPTLSRGDLSVCDKGGFKDDGIYVLRDHERGLMFCKRVLWLPGGWTIKSDNPSYEPMKVDDKAIEIIARVIAAIKEVK